MCTQVKKPLDRESNSQHEFTAMVRDGGTPSLSSTTRFTVVVEDSNDNRPQFQLGQVTSISVREDQVPGESLLELVATDADTGMVKN